MVRTLATVFGGPSSDPLPGVLTSWRSMVTTRRRKSTLSTVRPRHSPCRSPVPATNITIARKRSGMALRISRTCSVVSGTTRLRSTFGSLVPSHGLEVRRRSLTAARRSSTRVRARPPPLREPRRVTSQAPGRHSAECLIASVRQALSVSNKRRPAHSGEMRGTAAGHINAAMQTIVPKATAPRSCDAGEWLGGRLQDAASRQAATSSADPCSSWPALTSTSSSSTSTGRGLDRGMAPRGTDPVAVSRLGRVLHGWR